MSDNEAGESIDWSGAGGMEQGYVDSTASSKELEQKALQGESNWNKSVPTQYKSLANKWSGQQGVMKIIPVQQIQKFTLSVVADIAKGVSNPQPQIVPISDVSVVPHQISFDFFDTTEGKFGISNVIANKKISEKIVMSLLENGVTSVLSGFKNKEGKTFSARLILDKVDKKIKFSFK